MRDQRSIQTFRRTVCGVTAVVLISFVFITEFLAVAKAQNSAAPTITFKTLMKLAKQGNSVAQNNLGLKYAQGNRIEQNNTEALKWYLRAAEQGLPEAQNNVGLMYAEGLGAPRNDAEAVRWYRLSALQNFSVAQNNLGWMYDRGRGVGQNYEEAARWYRLSAEQELPNAQFNLAAMYEAGFGVNQDFNEAVRWYRKAAGQQHEQAATRVALLAPGLPSNEATLKEPNTVTLDPPAIAEVPTEFVAPIAPVVSVLPVVLLESKPMEEAALSSIPAQLKPKTDAMIPTGMTNEGLSTTSVASQAKATSNTPSNTQSATAFQAQLAAYRSEVQSLNSWSAMIAAYPSHFEEFSPSIERIDLGSEKGVFFRLMTGYFGTLDEAKDFCTQIIHSGASSGCIPRPAQ